MAHFTYDIIYQSQEIAPDLAASVAGAIEAVSSENGIDKSKTIEPGPARPNLRGAYKLGGEEYQVLFSVNSRLAKMQGTERATMQFAGLEENIIIAKSKLLDIVNGLELR
ncbi:hypothetical protein GOV14_03100 [Candidatus Pacearchaeota archaeon]|nr:hypothetical protein [Candidatus Pacearchaeota archaeon]